MTIDIQIKNSL